jgi:F-type H+-transporting ATPase subunit delta
VARYSDKELAIARVYAAAMLQLAQGLGEVDVLHHELEDLAARLEADDVLRAIMTTPTVDATKRTAMIERLFRGRYSDLFVDSLEVMNGKGRLGVIAALSEAYRQARDVLLGRVQVFIRSAAPLSDALKQRIAGMVERGTGQSPELLETIDSTLLGGLVVRIGDRKFDTSIARKLAVLRTALLDRASHEIHSGRHYFDGIPT